MQQKPKIITFVLEWVGGFWSGFKQLVNAT